MALNASNSNNLQQLALKGLIVVIIIGRPIIGLNACGLRVTG